MIFSAGPARKIVTVLFYRLMNYLRICLASPKQRLQKSGTASPSFQPAEVVLLVYEMTASQRTKRCLAPAGSARRPCSG